MTRRDISPKRSSMNARLYQAPDIYDGMDYIEGVAGKTHFRCSYVHAKEEREETVTETDSNGNIHTHTETHRYTIFAGLFFSADCNKYFHGHTVVTPGSGLNRPLFGGKSRVTMENPDFNREFIGKVLGPGGSEVPYHAGNDGTAHGAEKEIRGIPPLLHQRPYTDRLAGLV